MQQAPWEQAFDSWVSNPVQQAKWWTGKGGDVGLCDSWAARPPSALLGSIVWGFKAQRDGSRAMLCVAGRMEWARACRVRARWLDKGGWF